MAKVIRRTILIKRWHVKYFDGESDTVLENTLVADNVIHLKKILKERGYLYLSSTLVSIDYNTYEIPEALFIDNARLVNSVTR